MKCALLFFFVLISGCKSTKSKIHPLLREDGFYYRKKDRDIFQFVRFYPNERVAVSRRLTKKEMIPICPNGFMRSVDSSLKEIDSKITSFTIKNDSVFFLKKPDNYPLEPYNVLFACKLYRDSLTASLQVINFDSSVAEQLPFPTLKINPKITTTFKFIKASSKRKPKCPDIPGKDYDVDRSGKLKLEEL